MNLIVKFISSDKGQDVKHVTIEYPVKYINNSCQNGKWHPRVKNKIISVNVFLYFKKTT